MLLTEIVAGYKVAVAGLRIATLSEASECDSAIFEIMGLTWKLYASSVRNSCGRSVYMNHSMTHIDV